MSLLDDIKAENRNGGTPCTVWGVLQQLDRDNKKDAADLRAALADPNITASSIGRALVKRGLLAVKNSGDVITRHRRGDCRCDAD